MFEMRPRALNISLVSQWDSEILTTYFTFSWHCALLEPFIYRKRPPLGHTKPGRGWEKMLWLLPVSPCCFLRNMCDLKDKVVTEGKAGIFNDLPRAHGQSRSQSSVTIKLIRSTWIVWLESAANKLLKPHSFVFFCRKHELQYLGSLSAAVSLG